MKHLVTIAVLVVATAPLALGQTPNQRAQSDGRAEDEAAIRRILANWDRDWDGFDARLAAMDYADDAD
jgi:hypothetical protein